MNDEFSLKGKKVVAILRCSLEEQAESSIPQQKRACESYAEAEGMQIVRWVDYPGYSATRGEQVGPILEVINTKLSGEADYDGILLDSYNRFVRSAADEARLYSATIDAEVFLATVKEGPIIGEIGDLKRFVATAQSISYVRDLARSVSRAVIDMIERGLIPPCAGFPYGTCREYYDEHGSPQFRVYKLQDGRFEITDPVAPYNHRIFLGKKNRLDLRQKGWSFKMVPGRDELADAVRFMFTAYYRDGWSYRKVAADLNRRRVPTKTGAPTWSLCAVRWMINNPLYLGLATCCTASAGAICERNRGAPKMHAIPKRPGLTKDRKGRRKYIRHQWRPPEDWITVEQPALITFLPADVREIALKEWERKKREGWLKPFEKRTTKSMHSMLKGSYILTKLIKIKSDGYALIGSTGSINYRYYRSTREIHNPVPGAPVERCRAEPIEQEVLNGLRQLFSEFEPSTDLIKKAIKDKLAEVEACREDRQPLIREKETLEDRYRNIFRFAQSERGKELMADEVKGIEVRLDEIEKQLKTLIDPETKIGSPHEIISSVKEQFAELKDSLDSLSYDQKRSLIMALVPSIVYEPAAREFEIEFALPTWALSKGPTIQEHIGTVGVLDYPAGTVFRPTKTMAHIPLMRATCQFDNRKLNPCLTCSRSFVKAA